MSVLDEIRHDLDGLRECAKRLIEEKAELRGQLAAAKHDLSLLSSVIVESKAENAKLRALVESYGMIANEAVCDYYDRDEMLADANATACELGIEVGA